MDANVIKVRVHEEHSPPVVVKKTVHRASLDAAEIVAKARLEADAVIANAERTKDAIVEEGTMRGYKDGLDEWNETIREAWKARDEYLMENEQELIKLAAAIARKIVGDCANAEPHALLHTAREAIRAIRSDRKIQLRVRTADEALLRERLRELQAACAEDCAIVLVADASIALGGCIVESDVGTIDAQFETQLASLERVLLRGVYSHGE